MLKGFAGYEVNEGVLLGGRQGMSKDKPGSQGEGNKVIPGAGD